MSTKKEMLNELLNRPKSEENQRNPLVMDRTFQIEVEEPSTSTMQCVTKNNLRFTDVEEIFNKFEGDGIMNIQHWIEQFEEKSKMLELTPLEKLIYARKLMQGKAKLFTNLESKATTFSQFSSELLEEYGEKENSALIHEVLQRRRKKSEESETQYYYAMLTIASKSNIDELALIHHIVNGLPGPAHTKYYLRESPNLKELKKKLNIYCKSQMNEQFNERNTDKRCGNCGDKHKTADCPHKLNGPKCFKCNTFGHRSFDESCPLNSNDNLRVGFMRLTNEINDEVKL